MAGRTAAESIRRWLLGLWRRVVDSSGSVGRGQAQEAARRLSGRAEGEDKSCVLAGMAVGGVLRAAGLAGENAVGLEAAVSVVQGVQVAETIDTVGQFVNFLNRQLAGFDVGTHGDENAHAKDAAGKVEDFVGDFVMDCSFVVQDFAGARASSREVPGVCVAGMAVGRLSRCSF